AADEPRLDPEVRVGTRLARQSLPALRLLRGDAERQPVGVADLAGQQPGATRAAVAGLAAVREIEAGAESGFEHRLSRSDAQRPPVRLDAYLVLVRAQTAEPLVRARVRVRGRGLARGRALMMCCHRARLDSRAGEGQGAGVFVNPPPEGIEQLLRSAHIIAVVGLSANRTRPSHGVARAMQRFGYRIIPVTPAAESILGEPAVPSLDQLPEVLGGDERVDIVDVFRRPEHVAGIVSDCIRLELPALWLQEGVIDQAAAERAVEAGIFTVMDRCIFKARAALR